MPNLGEFAFCVALCALPTVFCVLIWRKSPLVRSLGRVLAVIGCVSMVGWETWRPLAGLRPRERRTPVHKQRNLERGEK